MGLFGKKHTNEDVLSEGKALYETGSFNEAYQKLWPLATASGNGQTKLEAQYYTARVLLENPALRGDKESRKNGLQMLQLAAKEGHAGAREYVAELKKRQAGAQTADAKSPAAVLLEKGLAYYKAGNKTEAFRCLHEAAQQGHAAAQYNAAVMLLKGDGVEKNPQQALVLLRAAAAQGHKGAGELLTKMGGDAAHQQEPEDDFNKGIAAYQAKRFEEALGYFRKAAMQGNASAQFNLGLMYYKGTGVEPDLDEAEAWCRKAAEQGHEKARGTLEELEALRKQSELQSALQKELRSVRQEAERESTPVTGQNELQSEPEQEKNREAETKAPGVKAARRRSNAYAKAQELYEHGEADDALQMFREAAEQGDLDAQLRVAAIYDRGECGVAVTKTEAFKWYLKAAEQGSADAQYMVGKMTPVYGAGKDKEAFKWYLKAAEQGHATAQYMLGIMSTDQQEATRWLLQAAEQGSADAQFLVAIRCKTGDGVKKDLSEAQRWFLAAAEQGHRYAKKELESMA